jgi:hypothetical protein
VPNVVASGNLSALCDTLERNLRASVKLERPKSPTRRIRCSVRALAPDWLRFAAKTGYLASRRRIHSSRVVRSGWEE